MFSDLLLLHRPGGKGRATLESNLTGGRAQGSHGSAHWFLWQTCLRQIALGEEASFDPSLLEKGDELYRGDAAYRFLLEVICGLHSPLLGETEVYGQFKNAVAAFAIPASPFGSQLKRFFRSLFEDAKSIRQAHLVDLGSQSYGSVMRRELKSLRSIHILGAGQLVEEILPWISKDGNEIHVYCRDPKKVERALGSFENLKIHDLTKREQLETAEALIVAAPVAAEWFQNWFGEKSRKGLEIVADLRADSAVDRIRLESAKAIRVPVLDLNQVFETIPNNQALLAERKAMALQAIAAAARERGSHVEYRPFGWEDVCA